MRNSIAYPVLVVSSCIYFFVAVLIDMKFYRLDPKHGIKREGEAESYPIIKFGGPPDNQQHSAPNPESTHLEKNVLELQSVTKVYEKEATKELQGG